MYNGAALGGAAMVLRPLPDAGLGCPYRCGDGAARSRVCWREAGCTIASSARL